jgi:amino-acid N-acetyltransferase
LSDCDSIIVRKARVQDCMEIFGLVNLYARRGLMLPKSRNQIYQNVRDFVVVEEKGQIVGCGALHVLWDDLAEIRSLAVVEERQGNGLGRLMVLHMLDEAREIGLPIVFTLTYVPGFFEKIGFKLIDKNELPRKIWVDCIDCVKFPNNCDEIALIREVGK